MTHGEYFVTGNRRYRGHQPGSTFEARLDRNAEARAIRRGDIQLLRHIHPTVQPGTYTFPQGWLPPPNGAATPTTQAAKAAFLLPEGG